MTRNKALILLHLCVFLWGFTAILGKLITFDSISLVWWRLVIVNISLALVLFFRRKKMQFRLDSLGKISLVGLVVAVHWMAFYSGIKLSNISITMIAFSSGTFFTALIEPIIYKRKISWNEVLIGLAIILVISYIGYGEYMRSLKENSLGNPNMGIIMGLIAAFTSSLFSTFNGVLIRKNNAFSISFIELISANIVLSIVMVFFFEVPDNLFSPSGEDLFWLLILGVACTAFPFIMSVEIMKKLTPFTTNLALNLESVYAIALGFIIFGESEQMTLSFYIGGVLILCLIVFNEVIKKRKLKLIKRKDNKILQ